MEISLSKKNSLSSYATDICATNEASKLIVALGNLAADITINGYRLSDANLSTDVFNESEACVKWSQNMTTGQICHMEQQETTVRK